MSKIKVAIVDNDRDQIDRIKEKINEEKNMEITIVAEDGKTALSKIFEETVDVVIMELLLPELDGFALVDKIRKQNDKTKIILTSVFYNPGIAREAFRRGVNYFVVKPYDANVIVERVKNIFNATVMDNTYSVDAIIDNSLLQIGMPVSLKGYKYVASGIKEAMEDQSVLEGVTKILYPDIAKKFDSTPQRVEKAIRHAIEVTWERECDCEIKKRLDRNLNKGKSRPTNSEFIATMSLYLRNSCNL